MSWREARLGDVADFVRGITFKPEDVVELGTPDSVACMRTKNVQAELNLSDVWAVPARLVKRAEQYLRYGDILVSSANSWNLVGKCSWVPELPWRATFGGYVSVLRVTSPNLLPRYLYHWFSSPPVQALVRSFGRQTTNISNLDVDRCLNLRIPLPPFPEQLRIAEVLDRAERLIAQRQDSLSKLNGLIEACFYEMFGDPLANPRNWERRRLGELATFVGGGTPSRSRPDFYEGSICWATSKDMKNDFLEDTQEHITEEAVRCSATKLVPPGTILVVVKSKILAHSLPVAITKVPTCFGQDLKGIQVGPECDVMYVAWSLRVGKQWLLAKTRGANTEGLTLEHLREFPILMPPRSLQEEFSRRVEVIETLKAAQRASLSELEALYASLQHCAFRGEL